VKVQEVGLIMTPITITPHLDLVTGADGTYYTVGGETQASPGRPVQPLTSEPLLEFNGMEPHDALFLAGSGRREVDFDPLVSRPVTDTALTEPEYDYDGWYPLKPFTVNRLGDLARLVVVPAQYYGNEANGIERLFEQMVFEVYYAEEGQDDFATPAIWGVEAEASEGALVFRVLVQDDSGVERVVVSYSKNGKQWQSFDLSYQTSGYWEGTLSGWGSALYYFVQAVDKVGNVGMSVNKGLFFKTEELVYLPLLLRDG
jgi:hypothetical protein